MTNEEIIQTQMMLHGITEPAHTFNYWKKRGYLVRRGEHAAFACNIWKCKPQKVKEVNEATGEEEEKKVQRMFMKKAYFFTLSQVDKMQ